MGLIKRLHIIYLKEKEIPRRYKIKRLFFFELQGYRNGFSFNFSIHQFEKDTLNIEYKDWEGTFAGSSHGTKYQWDGKKWNIIFIDPGVIY